MRVSSINDLSSLARTKRKEFGLTQAELAEEIGVQPLWVSQFERGKDTAHVGLVLRLLKALEIELWTAAPSASKDGEVIKLDDVLNRTNLD